MCNTVLKYEFSEGGTRRGAGNVSEVSFDNISFMEGLNKMFQIRHNEVIVGVEFINRGDHKSSVRAHIEKTS